MYINFSKIKNGQLEQSRLQLRTLAGSELGAIPYVHGLKFSINYADVSTIEFSTPYKVKGKLNPLYAAVTSYKIVYTENLGIYVLTTPQKDGDGMTETKTVTGYSLEYLFQGKNLFLEEGTYNFWNPVDTNNTILGRVVELDPNWHVGYVSPRLVGCYRTFDEYNSDALSFCYNDATEKYDCAFVFDVYEKSVNVYDANEKADCVPIYLDYENLVNTVGVQEISDDLKTKLHLYGSDGLSVREVNPTGQDYIVNLDYFIEHGDLDIKVSDDGTTLASRIRDWENSIGAKRTYYAGLVSTRASLTAQKLMAQAELGGLRGQLDTLMAQQSVIIQALALETSDSGKEIQQSKLDEINNQIADKNNEVSTQESKIESVQEEIEACVAEIKTITNMLSYETFFTEEERKSLAPYLSEGTISEETFVATDVETDVSGVSSKMSGQVDLINSRIQMVDIPEFEKAMYMISGGSLTIPDSSISAEVVRGTLETKGDNFVLTGYLGTTAYGDKKFSSGLITLSGEYLQFYSDVSIHPDDEIPEYTGTQISFQTSESNSYFTVNNSEFQQYSVAMDLYDYGIEILDDMAWPIYEFSVNSANFIYHNKFKPFKNKLQLGKAVYLSLGSEGQVTAKAIGIELNFDDISDFNLIFSNRYYRKNGVARWIKEIKNTSQSSRSFNASKYIYNRAADKMTAVDRFMNGQMVAAVNNIVNKENQTVLINGSGINIGGDSRYQLRIVDNMLAMTDNAWETAKLAIGLFASEETGTQWGVNAELIAGKLIVGNNMVLQNPLLDENGNTTGTMMFQVDSTGAWLYNSRFVLQSDNGLIFVDPKYGIAAGTQLLFDTNGTTVTPEFMDGAGDITFDSEGMPENANFFLDINTGNAYFRGHVSSGSGTIGGWTLENDNLHAGSGSDYVALNSSKDNNSLYAIWAGSENPDTAPFWVKKNGDVRTKNMYGSVEFSKDPVSDEYGWLYGCGISVGGPNYLDKAGNFVVDDNGNVKIGGDIKFATGSKIIWETASKPWSSDVNGAVNDESVFNVLTNGGTKWGVFQDSENGRLYINAAYLRIGEGGAVTFGKSDGGITIGQGSSNGSNVTTGPIMYGCTDGRPFDSASMPYIIVTEAGCRMTAVGEDFYVAPDIIHGSSEYVSPSDKRLKNNIEYDLDKYARFFHGLKPSSYRYNNGTSGRLHLGYIYQDVLESLEDAEIPSSDFAGVVRRPVHDDNGNVVDYEGGLRYADFVPLNTYMIQRLYAEVAQLKEELQSLQNNRS